MGEKIRMSVKKFSITVVGDDYIAIDKIHDSIAKVAKGHLTTWEESTRSLRTRPVNEVGP